MKRETLDNLKRDGWSFDYETDKSQPGLGAPPPVCGAYAYFSDAGKLRQGLLDADASTIALLKALQAGKTLVGAFIAYDCCVALAHVERRGWDVLKALRIVFKAYRQGRVYDVLLGCALNDLANGEMLGKRHKVMHPTKGVPTDRYSLVVAEHKTLGTAAVKEMDIYRTSYALLRDTPIDRWPSAAKQYPLDDTKTPLQIALKQVKSFRNLHDMSRQAMAEFNYYLSGQVWGIRVNQDYVDIVEKEVAQARIDDRIPFIEEGLLHPDGKQNLLRIKQDISRAYGVRDECPECTGGKVPGKKVERKCKACRPLRRRCGKCRRLGAPCEKCQEKLEEARHCAPCGGNGIVMKSVSVRNCSGCDGTGLDLHTTPGMPLTEKGAVMTKRDILSESGDELLMNYAEYTRSNKVLGTYIGGKKGLRTGWSSHHGTIPVLQEANTLLETGRSAYRGLIQLFPRRFGLRECHEARPGYMMFGADYAAIELAGHAQSCLWIPEVGYSKLAEAINDDMKVHDMLGASIAGMPYEEFLRRRLDGDKVMKSFRQTAKKANFGYPGRCGAVTLVLQCRAEDEVTVAPDGTVYQGTRFCITMGGAEKCGVEKVTEWGSKNFRREIPPTCLRCIHCAQDLREMWLGQWTENVEYFKYIGKMERQGKELIQHVSKRIRGGAGGNAMANSYFQGLVADGKKAAMAQVHYEQYCRPESDLYHSRLLADIHDELLNEGPVQLVPAAAERLVVVMEEQMREYIPDVKIEAEPFLSHRWYKGAEEVRADWREAKLEGRKATGPLIPWSPELAKEMKIAC